MVGFKVRDGICVLVGGCVGGLVDGLVRVKSFENVKNFLEGVGSPGCRLAAESLPRHGITADNPHANDTAADCVVNIQHTNIFI